jgi:hypothetical protein
MTPEECAAGADAAFAIERAHDGSLDVLIALAGREVIYMAWTMGYLSGQANAFSVATEELKRSRA